MRKSFKEESKKKFIRREELEERIKSIGRDKRIVTLNGSFDLLHAGHLEIIYEAKKLGDVLIVMLNSDESIRKYKSEKRPVVPFEYRKVLISAIEFVDYITVFDEKDPRNILKIIKPDIHVNGEEYGLNCIEAEIVKKFGGRIHLVKKYFSLSTSKIIEKIKCDL
jgi:rfaE bifunctional protein nucleotidyltransferase chain/domain